MDTTTPTPIDPETLDSLKPIPASEPFYIEDEAPEPLPKAPRSRSTKAYYTPAPKEIIKVNRKECLLYKGKYCATPRLLAELSGMHYISICNHTYSGKVEKIKLIGGETLIDVDSWEAYKNTLGGSGKKKGKNTKNKASIL